MWVITDGKNILPSFPDACKLQLGASQQTISTNHLKG